MEKTDAASMPLRQSSADEFLVIRNFMIAEGGLGLTGTQAYVYALIYQFSVDGKGAFFGSLAYLSSRCGISRRAAIMALQALKQRGLIAEYGVRSNGSKTKHYYAVPKKAEEAKEAYAAYWAAKRAAAGREGAISAPARPRRAGALIAPEACRTVQEMHRRARPGMKKMRSRVQKMHRPNAARRSLAAETSTPH